MSEKKLNSEFDLELNYDPDAPALAEEAKLGHYIGSGTGRALGDDVSGEVRWTLFETQGATVCQSNLFGVIETEDGAEINFDSMGVFKVPDKSKPHFWLTTAGVHFETGDERYAWLNQSLASWQGELDMNKYQHKYRVRIHQA